MSVDNGKRHHEQNGHRQVGQGQRLQHTDRTGIVRWARDSVYRTQTERASLGGPGTVSTGHRQNGHRQVGQGERLQHTDRTGIVRWARESVYNTQPERASSGGPGRASTMNEE